ncbi:MAG: pyruvate kinase [Kiritimatiellales bacterium]|nr:pyruvate kinase [Kiritimatiellales bacterium]
MRSTKIICTIGPASNTPEMLKKLAEAGMNIVRLNLSHGTYDSCRSILNDIKQINLSREHCIATMLDTKGAEIRTGVIAHPIPIHKDQEVVFSHNPLPNEKRTVIEVNYDRFFADVPETDRIVIDNGELMFDIVSVEKDETVIGKAQGDGSIGSRRHINLPGADIDLPSVTEQDWKDITFAIEEDVDFLALSFIRTANEVKAVRDALEEKGSSIQIITKVETQQAVDNFSEILAVSDAIMVARGDLGTDIPFEELPVIQDEMVSRCRDQGIPIIVATHMLESMTDHPMPTRAEVTDVAHAAMTGVDATMLSGETAAGKYPIKAVEAMNKILTTTEKHLSRFPESVRMPVHNEREARAEAAVTLSASSNADALLVFTRSGRTAREVSKFRPYVPILALTNEQKTQQNLQLCYGIHPLLIDFKDPEATVQIGINAAKEAGFVQKGNSVTLLSDTEAKNAPIQSVQVREV